MSRARELPPVFKSPTHTGGQKPCIVMTETFISTIELAEGHFACMTFSRPDLESGAVIVLDRDEVEAQIAILRNAMDDAERADRGEPMVHASPSDRTH